MNKMEYDLHNDGLSLVCVLLGEKKSPNRWGFADLFMKREKGVLVS